MVKTTVRAGLRMAWINLMINALLAAGKLAVGVLAHSGAMLSDGVHSVADVLSTGIVIVGIKLSARRADNHHPYGHERMECVAAVVLAMVIGASGIGIGVAGIRTMCTADFGITDPPAMAAAFMALSAIAVKEAMFRVTKYVAARVDSAALMADAWHQRTDALSSLGGLIGVVGANMGLAVLDPAAGVLIGLLIVKAALDIFADAMRKMTDRACDDELQQRLAALVTRQPQVMSVRSLKTRLFGNRIYAEVTVGIDGALSCMEAYEAASTVRRAVENEFEQIKECLVRVQPMKNS